jgi:hypothetical protein
VFLGRSGRATERKARYSGFDVPKQSGGASLRERTNSHSLGLLVPLPVALGKRGQAGPWLPR